MTRGRTIWLAILAVGLALALLLRTPRGRRSQQGPRAVASLTPRNSDESAEFEIEVADPSEVGIAPRPPARAGAALPTNEAEFVRTLASLSENEPGRALALADEGEKRFGESSYAVERRFYEIKALVKLGRIGSARTKGERYLERYPPGPMTDEVERLTGVHRRPQREKAP